MGKGIKKIIAARAVMITVAAVSLTTYAAPGRFSHHFSTALNQVSTRACGHISRHHAAAALQSTDNAGASTADTSNVVANSGNVYHNQKHRSINQIGYTHSGSGHSRGNHRSGGHHR